jgi:hypothetical protein
MSTSLEATLGGSPRNLRSRGGGGGEGKQEKIKMKERCERGKGKFDEEFVDNYSALIREMLKLDPRGSHFPMKDVRMSVHRKNIRTYPNITSTLTKQATPLYRILFEKLLVTLFFKKFCSYVTRKFISTFSKAHILTLP